MTDSSPPSDDPTLGVTLASGDEQDTGRGPTTRRVPLELERGAPIGRYVVLARVGRGGMGTVYAAYDPELDRRVAIKLMHVDGDSDTLAGNRRTRLLREAQAMARLSHPHVVAVHDVGAIDGDVFLAMEFVEGSTLAEWMKGKHSWRQTLTMFEQAGRGLAAAHGKDLVHRDFKPDNVLVGIDGRPRVTDFGLARAVSDPTGPESTRHETTAEISLPTGSDVLDSPLTMTGALMGTPAYMSPEQFLGRRADARSDQFSFCVALWEALFGVRPFAGESPAALALAVTEGWLRAPPRHRHVPSRLRRALERGLSPRAADRYPSMNALLDALVRDPLRRWKQFGSMGGAGLVLAGAFVGLGHREPALCEGAAARLAGVWDDTERQRVTTAFEAAERSHATATLASVLEKLDAYAQVWQAAHTEACEATHVRGEQSSELLDLRMACLERRRIELEELVERLAEADTSLIRMAVRAVERLSAVETCAEAEMLSTPLRPPRDSARRDAVEAVEATLARIRAIRSVGKFAESVALAEAAYADALATEHRPLVADAAFELGVSQWLTDQPRSAVVTLESGFHEALAAGHDFRAAETASELVHVYAGNLEELALASLWATLAGSVLERLDRDPETDPRLTNALGITSEKKGDYEEALRRYEASAAAREQSHGRRDIGVANAINNIALVLEIQSKYEEALARHREALAIRAELGGSEHPDVADSYNNIGLALQNIGRIDEAKESFERAIAIYDAAMGPGSLTSAAALNNLGSLMSSLDDSERALELFGLALEIRERELGSESTMVASVLKNRGRLFTRLERFDEARPELERALAIQREQLGPDHPYAAETMSLLGDVERHTGNHQAAIAHYEAALDLLEQAFPSGHAMTAQVRLYLARARRDGGDPKAALETFERALTMAEATAGPSHSMVGNITYELGVMHLEGGRAAAAVPLLERSVAIRETEHTPDVAVGNARFALARALQASGQRDRAREFSVRARQSFSAASRDDRLAELDAWLRHPR